MIDLKKLTGLNIYAKAEYLNPGGSIKDRVAKYMIEQEEAKGLLNPGATIMEPTSGNTGIGLAMVGIQKGYRVVIVMPENMSEERKKIIRALGAELILTDAGESIAGSVAEVERQKARNKDIFVPQQFENPDNPYIHYATTAAEIWEQMAGKIDVFVSGLGSGGTLQGVGRLIKEKNPDAKVVAVEPKNVSALLGHEPGLHKIQGIGDGFVPSILDISLIDTVMKSLTTMRSGWRGPWPAGRGFSSARLPVPMCGLPCKRRRYMAGTKTSSRFAGQGREVFQLRVIYRPLGHGAFSGQTVRNKLENRKGVSQFLLRHSCFVLFRRGLRGLTLQTPLMPDLIEGQHDQRDDADRCGCKKGGGIVSGLRAAAADDGGKARENEGGGPQKQKYGAPVGAAVFRAEGVGDQGREDPGGAGVAGDNDLHDDQIEPAAGERQDDGARKDQKSEKNQRPNPAEPVGNGAEKQTGDRAGDAGERDRQRQHGGGEPAGGADRFDEGQQHHVSRRLEELRECDTPEFAGFDGLAGLSCRPGRLGGLRGLRADEAGRRIPDEKRTQNARPPKI
jgi:cysteine synthase A